MLAAVTVAPKSLHSGCPALAAVEHLQESDSTRDRERARARGSERERERERVTERESQSERVE